MTARSQMASEAAVIQRKIRMPPLSAHVVGRPRVERRLAALAEAQPLLVVSATAGAGKTTAVARATEFVNRPVAWLTVDRTDAAPGRLVAYLEAALARTLPRLAGVAKEALAAGLSHPESVGLLAEAVGEDSVLLVLDDLERLGDGEDAWTVLEALVRYAPPTLRTVLISRRDVPAVAALPIAASATVGDADLAFTAPEATAALAAVGNAEVDPNAAVEATGGWVTGVLFEAWRSSGHTAGVGGEADPLFGYLAAHIVGRLSLADTDFLIRTSLLDEVTAGRAERLGVADASERLASVRVAHLPVSWQADGRAMRCHARFREYLLERLERRPGTEVRALRLAHGRLLADEGLDEEATEELLLARASGEALGSAERAILPVVERLDFAIAERWLAALADVARDEESPLTTAELMLAVGREDYLRGLEIADRLAQRDKREVVARSAPRVAALMAWCYLHVGRFDDVHALLAIAEQDPTVDAVRYALRPLEDMPDTAPPVPPSTTGGAVDALLLRACYHLGRLTELVEPPASRWAEALTRPWRIGALRATGHTQQALELYESAQAAGVGAVGLHALVGPELLVDAGRAAEAHAALERGREIARSSGSRIFELFNGVVAAKLALRLDRDPAAARAVLDELERALGARRFPQVREMADTWYGFALLIEDEHEAALARLREAVSGMLAGGRVLELPTAAVYLAEAEWRAGNEERADRAADLALEGSRHHGSNHVLLQALVDFPAVASRRIDAEPVVDSAWHDLGRALIAQDVTIAARIRATVELEEFGSPLIRVDGRLRRPRIAKSYELLALLALRRPEGAERDELLDALFAGRADESTRAYLRQAVHHLRLVVPGVASEGGRVWLTDDVRLTTASQRLELELAEAARLRGDERLAATVKALAVLDRGEYLPGVQSAWAEERQRRLADLATGARYEIAELAFSAGQLGEAQRWTEEVLRADPHREAAWRLSMRVASALGDDDGVIVAYHGCERALEPLGIEPSRGTHQLLERLRR